MIELKLIILTLFLIDMILTYLNANKYKKLYPEKDYTSIELNPIPKYFWKKFGLLNGGIISVIIQLSILLIVLSFFDRDTFLIFIGMYIVFNLIHLDNYNLLKKQSKSYSEEERERQKERKWLPRIMVLLSFIDLSLTYFYIKTYSNWIPERLFSEMEQNPLLLFLWNTFGLELGMLFGALIIFSLIYLIGKKANLIIVITVIGVIVFAIFINIQHIIMLLDLIKLYPTGFA